MDAYRIYNRVLWRIVKESINTNWLTIGRWKVIRQPILTQEDRTYIYIYRSSQNRATGKPLKKTYQPCHGHQKSMPYITGMMEISTCHRARCHRRHVARSAAVVVGPHDALAALAGKAQQATSQIAKAWAPWVVFDFENFATRSFNVFTDQIWGTKKNVYGISRKKHVPEIANIQAFDPNEDAKYTAGYDQLGPCKPTWRIPRPKWEGSTKNKDSTNCILSMFSCPVSRLLWGHGSKCR